MQDITKISLKLRKDAAKISSIPLTAIFNSSFEMGTFPDIWMIARVTSIFKSGQYLYYLLLEITKKTWARSSLKILKDTKQISKCQHAFLKMNNTLTALLNITDSWFSNIYKRKINISVFLDLMKAFDTVDHGILLSKLTKYKVTGIPLWWFTSYLTNRKQYCLVNGQKSSLKLVHCGIPQGSCLGPLLLILYVNDF